MGYLETVAAATLTKEDYTRHIRDLTDDEVETFARDGVVHVKNFIDKELVAKVLDRFIEWSGLMRDWPEDQPGQQEFVRRVDQFTNRKAGSQFGASQFGIRQSDPWMFNFVTQRKLGEAAARLLKVPSVKILSETLHCKYPSGSGLSKALDWHQDYPFMPIDRPEAVQTWLALVPITPEMGSMSHLLGSHRSPPAGMLSVFKEDPQELYPEVFSTYPASQPRFHDAGDAVFHHVLTWHKSDPNLTDRPRWAMSNIRISARSLYTGQVNFNTDDLGLEPRKPFDHPNFPTVFP